MEVSFMKYNVLKIIALILAVLTVVLCIYLWFSGSDSFVIALVPLVLSLIIQAYVKNSEKK